MAYDDTTFRRRDSQLSDAMGVRDDSRLRGGGGGFRGDSEYDAEPAYRTGSYPVAGSESRTSASAGSGGFPPGELEDAFDDPEHGDPGQDRLGVHLAWEGLLLVGVGVLAVLLYREEPTIFSGDKLNGLLTYAAALGLLAVGGGLCLRAAVPNLALGPIAMIAALYFAHEGGSGLLPATGAAVAGAAALGAVIAVLVVIFHVPSWAASLATALGAIVWIQQVDGPVRVTSGFDPTDYALYLFSGVAALAVFGGVLGSIRSVRRSIGRFRPVGDPAVRRGAMPAGLAGLALVGSAVLAALGGVVFAASDATVVPTPGLELTGLALGVAMLGGTSAFGRRGGLFGTLLAVVLVTLFVRYDAIRGWDISLFAIAAGALAIGLVATRAVETYGRPVSWSGDYDGELDDRAETGDADSDGWVTATPGADTATSGGSAWSDTRSTARSDGWMSGTTGTSTLGRGDPWADERWGTPPR